MFKSSKEIRLKDILQRISRGDKVSLDERLFLSQCADADQTISASLTRARRNQLEEQPADNIDRLLNDLDIGISEPDSAFRPGQDDLGDWFMGAPSWLGRS